MRMPVHQIACDLFASQQQVQRLCSPVFRVNLNGELLRTWHYAFDSQVREQRRCGWALMRLPAANDGAAA